MPINYDELMALKNLDQKFAYGDREVMLYAYGIGMGADPMDEKELAFVNEAAATPRPLKVVPTFASVAAWGASPSRPPPISWSIPACWPCSTRARTRAR
jgi:hypothetical protein